MKSETSKHWPGFKKLLSEYKNSHMLSGISECFSLKTHPMPQNANTPFSFKNSLQYSTEEAADQETEIQSPLGNRASGRMPWTPATTKTVYKWIFCTPVLSPMARNVCSHDHFALLSSNRDHFLKKYMGQSNYKTGRPFSCTASAEASLLSSVLERGSAS